MTNEHGNYPILEIFKTQPVIFTNGIAKTKASNGAKIKCTTSGTLQVRYAGNDAGKFETLEVIDPKTWLPDRIVEIKEAGSTLTASQITFGW